MSIRLNLGCGGDKREGYINIDIRKSVEPDLILDLENEGLPYNDNSVEEVVAQDFLEHISWKKAVWLLKEIYRVLRPEGILKLRCPDLFRILSTVKNHSYGWEKASFWICGAQDYPENVHKSAFWKDSLALTLREIGFKIVEDGYDDGNFLITARK